MSFKIWTGTACLLIAAFHEIRKENHPSLLVTNMGASHKTAAQLRG